MSGSGSRNQAPTQLQDAELLAVDDDSRSPEPEFALIMGTGVCGKTRLRHAQFANSHVNVDAGDIFRRLEGERIRDFPGEHREAIDFVGRVIAMTAIGGKHNIVTEVHGVVFDTCPALINAMVGVGYKANVIVLECERGKAKAFSSAN